MSKDLKEEDVNPEADAVQTEDNSESVGQPDSSGLLAKLEEAMAESQAQKEKYLRSVADMENFRKRALREKEEVRRLANISLVEELLPIMDNFSLGLASAQTHEAGKVFADGFGMILGQMRNVLKENGLEEIVPLHEPFDPNFHESLGAQAHATVEEGLVIEVQRVGYRMNDRLLRPAAVILSSGPETAETVSTEEA